MQWLLQAFEDSHKLAEALETNCINAAGFYAADLMKLAAAIDAFQS